MDRFLTLKVFTTVIETGSFVGAARALDMAPATVTEHIQALESRLKTRLINRTTRRIALTGEGGAYFEHCREILSRVEEADSMLAAQRASPKGTLRVMMPQLLGTRIVIPGMPDFLARYPDLKVEFMLSPEAPDLVAKNLDLSLQITTQPDPNVVFRPLGLCAVRTLASPRYLAKRGVPKTPDDLDRHDVIGVRAAPGVFLSTMRFQRDGRMISKATSSRLTADSGDAQRVAALADLGVFQAYHYAVADLLESGALIEVLADWHWSGPPLGAVHLPNRYLSPKVQVFLDYARQLLAGKISSYRSDWDNR